MTVLVLSFVLVFTGLIPLLGKSEAVYAETDTCYDVIVGNSGANIEGTSSLSPRTTAKWTETYQMRNSKGNYLYCVDPFIQFKNAGAYSVSNMLGYGSVTQDDLNYTGAGLDYIWTNYGSNDALCYAYAQAFVWHAMDRKLTYRMSHFGLKGDYVTPVDTVTPVLVATYAYANANKHSYVGYGKYYQKGGSQPLAMFGFVKQGYAKLQKVTKSNKHLTDICPEQYTLAGATYGIYSDSACTSSVGSFTTNASGVSNTVTLKPGTYYVKEVTAPKGYTVDTKVYPVTVTAGKTTTVNVADEPIFDPLSLKIEKRIEEGADKNLSVEGAEYTVKYYKSFLNETQVKAATPFRTWVFKTDKNGFFQMRDKWKVGGDALFKNDKGNPVGLQGTYTIEETKAPRGLARTKGIISIQKVEFGRKNVLNSIVVLKDVTDIEKTQKINLHIQKKDAETGEAKPQGYGSFEGAEYSVFWYDPIENIEKLIGKIVTDAFGKGSLKGLRPLVYKIKETKAPKGYLLDETVKLIKAGVKEINTAEFDYSAESPETPTTVEIKKTGLNKVGVKEQVKGAVLQLFKEDGTFIEEWTTDGNVKTFKGLEIGKYRIYEKEAPDGYIKRDKDVYFEVKAVAETQKTDVFNERIPKLSSFAKFDTGVKESKKLDEVKVIDRIYYQDVIPGKEYTLFGNLVDRNGKPLRVRDNDVIHDMKKFTPEKVAGYIDLEYTLNPKKLEKLGFDITELTAYVNIRKDGKMLAQHNDFNDELEKVRFPEIKTSLTDSKTGNHEALAGKKVTLIDKVQYKDLTVGKLFTISGTLVNKKTGKPIMENGKEIKASKEFRPTEKDGTVEITFTFNASTLKGESVVAFEKVSRKGIEVAVHADIKDEGQTVDFPKVMTKASVKGEDIREVHAKKSVEFTDEITYENLNPKSIYYIKGYVIDKETRKVLAKAEGNLMPEKRDVKTHLDFYLDTTNYKGHELVVFEEAYQMDDEGEPKELIAEHKDINDKGQTIKVVKPEVKTTATVNGKHKEQAGKVVTVVDKVEYKDLILGKEYTVKGVLMDKKTGKPILENGKEIRAEKKFTAKEKDGYINLEFRVDSAKLTGKKLVAFEKLYQDKLLVGSHEDLNDELQTVEFYKAPDTGDMNIALPLFGSIIIVCIGTLIYMKGRRNVKEREE